MASEDGGQSQHCEPSLICPSRLRFGSPSFASTRRRDGISAKMCGLSLSLMERSWNQAREESPNGVNTGAGAMS